MKTKVQNLGFLAALWLYATLLSAQVPCNPCGSGADGAFSPAASANLTGGTYNFTSVNIPAGVVITVIGSQPLIINCMGNVQIDGTLRANGNNGGDGVTYVTFGAGGTGVAGGSDGGNGVFSPSIGPLDGSDGFGPGGGGHGSGWSGGGGGGHENAGGTAGPNGGTGGTAYGNAQLTPVYGGSGGGGGSGGYNCGSGGGGGGGGVILINACVTVTIGASGMIQANGGNGGSDGGGNCGSGGGGAGGSIWVVAPTIVNSGTVQVLGGVGGASTIGGSPYFGVGGAGSTGRMRLDACVSNPFISTWKTDNPGTSNNTSITIPTTGVGYNYDVDWDNDGTYDQTGITGNVTHDFGVAATYTIRIRGSFPRIYFNNGGDRQKLLGISQWGNSMVWTSMGNAFFGCSNLNINATDVPNLNAVTDMSFMFAGCTALNGPANIGTWNTSTVTNMQSMFENASSFNQPIGTWTLNPTVNMIGMLNNSGMDCSSYASTLIGWNANPATPNGRTLGAVGLTYAPVAVAARTNLVTIKGWTIDGDVLGSGSAAPLANCMQAFCIGDNPTVASLAPNGPGFAWYSTATGGAPLVAGTPLVNGGKLLFGKHQCLQLIANPCHGYRDHTCAGACMHRGGAAIEHPSLSEIIEKKPFPNTGRGF